MPDFTVCTLASSSKGNCVYIRIGEDEILIDAGISCKRICDALKTIDTDITRIKAIFVTHEHSDHIAGLETLSKKYGLPIHITEPSAASLFAHKKNTCAEKHAVIHPIIYSVEVGALTVQSFATPHDSAASVGYVVTDGTHERTVALATDIGFVSDEVSDALTGVENVILESNHDENMLLCGPYPYELKRRILSDHGHLSNENAAAFAARLAASGTKRILLAHLSQENNLPEIAYHSALLMTEGSGIFLGVAHPNEPTRLV